MKKLIFTYFHRFIVFVYQRHIYEVVITDKWTMEGHLQNKMCNFQNLKLLHIW